MTLSPTVREQLKAMGKTVWSAGHWDESASYIDKVGPALLDDLGVEPGMRLLDVGAGSGGSVAIPAALRGASVVASDLVADHFEDGRRRAAEAGVEIEWVEADATDMPFEDGAFDRVVSTFGHMFAADQEAAAAELARVTKPGGAIGIACWTPDGLWGQVFKLQSSFMPPPPPGVVPPTLWGTEDRVTELLGSQGLELSFEKRVNHGEHDGDLNSFFDNIESTFGPLVMAQRVLGEKWGEMQAQARQLMSGASTVSNGVTRIDGEYLQTIARKPA